MLELLIFHVNFTSKVDSIFKVDIGNLYNATITAHQITDNLKITKQKPHSSANYESYLIHAALK